MLASAVTSLLCLGGILAQDVKPPSPLAVETRKAETLQPDRTSQAEEEGRFTPPTRAQLYRVESEAAIAERTRQKWKNEGKSNQDFPSEDTMQIKTTLQRRKFNEMMATVQASYVVHQPLYFQQINHERYGWELGVFQPVVSTAQFYGDVLLFPYKFAANPPWHCDANLGYALPGDPEPLRFLTTPFSWRGVIGQTGTMIGGVAVFP
jgi:hypothetical protein